MKPPRSWIGWGMPALLLSLGCGAASRHITPPDVAPPARASAPAAAQAAWLRGRMLAAQGEPQAAVEEIGYARRLDPGSASLALGLAEAQADAGDGEAALLTLQGASTTWPGEPAVWLALGLQARALGQGALAEQALAQCEALAPGWAGEAARRALAELALDQGQAALAAERLTALQPAAGADFGARGLLWLRLGRAEPALADLSAALALASAEPAWLSALLQIAVSERRFLSVERALQRGAARWPDDPALFESRLRVAAAAGDPVEAAEALWAWPGGAPGWAVEVAAAVRPGPAAPAAGARDPGRVALAQGDFSEALTLFEGRLEALPADVDAWSGLATALDGLGRGPEAALARERASRYAAWRSKR